MKLLSYLKNDELMFKVLTGLKFVFISGGFTFCVMLFTFLLTKVNLIYFVANGFPGAIEFQDAFVGFVYLSLVDVIPYAVVVAFIIFALGYYLASIMLRPFKAIRKCCEDRLANKSNAYYTPDYLSDLKLLTSFSVYFFSHIDEAQKKGKLLALEIPEDYTRIHEPVFEKNFFFNYFFIIIIFAILASIGILIINSETREQIFQLSQKFLTVGKLANSKGIRYFIDEQFSIANIAVIFFLIIHSLTYFIFGLHLYGKVAGPSFAVFATMRSFLKGNYHNRIHLIGHYYLRQDCRMINKYLDYIQKNLT